MVYNRCIGTRYCSNNCPYKVRRFNFLAYADYATRRSSEADAQSGCDRAHGAGVMEKCTYCIQRIIAARGSTAKKETGEIREGEIVTACQQACPAEAIVFGDIIDPTEPRGEA